MTKEEAQRLTKQAIIDRASVDEVYNEIVERITNEAKDGSDHVYICHLKNWEVLTLNRDMLETVFKKLQSDGFVITTKFDGPGLDSWVKIDWK